MLCLARKVGDSITFFVAGESFTVEVSRVSGERVTLAIDAPRSVEIVRTELLEPHHDHGNPVG